MATYACHVGFELSGDETRICSKGGEWLGVMPSCERMYMIDNLLNVYGDFFILLLF